MQYLIILLVMFLCSVPINAELWALDVGCESVENYSGCGCASGNLSYTNDQCSKFMNRIDDWHTRKFWYANGNAWNRDFVDESKGGTDNYTADSVHIMMISGHGNRDTATFYGFLCKSSGWNYCNFNSSANQMYLGETGTTYPGKLRFLILCTCHSVDKTYAANIWGPVFWRGYKNLMYVMGYTGTSADSYTTDEVGEDFASKAAGSGWTLKQAWFWAIEDWWVNDTGALVSHGSNCTNAVYNRDNMKLNWSPAGQPPYCVAWSWHGG